MTGDYMIVLCREVSVRTGQISVYEVHEKTTDELLAKLRIRAKLNPELRYFTTLRVRWEGVWHDDYYRLLKKKEVTDASLQMMGGIVELK